MPLFYDNLNLIEKSLAETLIIQELGQGIITVNGHRIDTNQQVEMLTPDFFTGTAMNNSTIKAFQDLFTKMGLLPSGTSSIPIIRDIPLRTHTVSPNAKAQFELFTGFLQDNVLANQWSMLFPKEYHAFRETIAHCYSQKPTNHKKITVDSDGNPLSSGGYEVGCYTVNGLELWLRMPTSTNENDINAAIDNSLSDTENTTIIVNSLKSKLLRMDKIAFNIRGITKALDSYEAIQNSSLGGGHQHFLMLDRTTHTIYAINDTRNATDEDPRAFKHQIEMFLQALGDKTPYQFEFIQGKSRQPDNANYLRQACSISQFFHYAAILAGVDVHLIQEHVPAKLSTLMYLLQYAYVNHDQGLYNVLETIAAQVNEFLNRPQPPVAISPVTNEGKLEIVKKTLEENSSLLAIITRLEKGSKSHNPYWLNSSKKLNCIIDNLYEAIVNKEDLQALLADHESPLSKAINMRRLPAFSFFGLLKQEEVVSQKILSPKRML